MKNILQLCWAFTFICGFFAMCYGATAECATARRDASMEELACKFVDHSNPAGEHCKAAIVANRRAMEVCSSFGNIEAPGQQYDYSDGDDL